MGFATANLAEIDAQVPGDGVYAGLAWLGDGGPRAAAVHIGPNATFGERARSVEVHLIDFEGDLYGQSLEVDLPARIRPSRKFDRVEDLLAQIAEDVARARDIAGV